MKEQKIKILYLYDKKDNNDVDFIFEDGSFSYTYIDEKGFIKVCNYTDRLNESSDLNNIVDELQPSIMYISDFNGENFPKARKITKNVLEDILFFHRIESASSSSTNDFELIKIEKSKNDGNNIKAFLQLFGGFNFNKKEVSCNENK